MEILAALLGLGGLLGICVSAGMLVIFFIQKGMKKRIPLVNRQLRRYS